MTDLTGVHVLGERNSRMASLKPVTTCFAARRVLIVEQQIRHYE